MVRLLVLSEPDLLIHGIIVGVVKVFNGVYEGFHNAPSLYGSEVRKAKKITGTSSGFKEGGKVRLNCARLNDSPNGVGLLLWHI